jgi:hypothetical protein
VIEFSFFHQRLSRQIITAFDYRQARFFFPIFSPCIKAFQLTLDFFSTCHHPGARRFYFNQRVFHFPDH